MNNKEINFGINFNINKQNLNDLRQSLDQIIAKASQFEEAAADYAEPYREAAVAARDLKSILDSSWNSKLNQLDFSKVERQLVNSYGSIKDFKSSLELIGPEAQRAFGLFSSSILNTQAPLKQTNALLDKMAVTMANTVRFGISSSIFNNLTSSVSKAYNYTVKLDKALNDIRIVSGESADQMEKFAKQANTAAKNLGSTTLEYADAALIYYQQGLGDEEIAQRTETTIKMSNALQTSAEEVSNYMTAIWNNFAKGGENLEYYADVLTALGAATASSAEEIAGGLEKFAAVGDTVGLSYEYATAALTTITATTRQSEDVVGTALKTLFARIQDLELGETLDDGTTLGKYSEALNAIGISIKDQDGELKKMDVILSELGSKWDSMSKAQQVALAQTVAGTRQYTQLVALMDNWDFFETNLATAQSATGELDKQQAIYLEGMQAHLDQLEASWEGLYDTIFDEELIKNVADILSTLVDGLNTFVTGWGGGLNNLIYPITLVGGALSTHLAENLVRIKTNAEAAQKQVENLEVQQRLMKELSSTGSIDSMRKSGVEETLKEQEITQKLITSKVRMNQEDQIKLAQLDQQLIALNSQEEVYSEIVRRMDEIAKSSSMEDTQKYLNMSSKEKATYFKDEYQKLKEETIENIKQNNEIIEKLGKMSDSSTINNKTKAVLSNTFAFTKEEINSLREVLDSFDEIEKKQGYLTQSQEIARKSVEDTILARERELDVLDDVIHNKAKLGEIDKNEIVNALQNQNIYLEKNSDLYKRIVEEIQRYGKVSKETMQRVLEDTKNQKESLEEYRQNLANQSSLIDKQAAQFRGLFTVMSSVSSLYGTGKTLFNPDISGWDKFKSIVTNTGFQFFTISESLAEMKKGLPQLAADLLKGMTIDQATLMIKNGQTAQLTLQVAKQTVLNGLQAAYNGLLAVAKALMSNWITILLAVAAAIAGIVMAYDKWFSKEAQLNREIEKTEKLVEDTRQAYQDLSNTISTYEDSLEGIKGLQEGTLEFYEAILKANEAAMQLIDTLELMPGADYSIDANGLIKINEDSLDKILKEQLREYNSVQARNYMAQAEYLRTSEESGLPAIVKDFTKELNKLTSATITKEMGEALLQGNYDRFDELVSASEKQTDAINNSPFSQVGWKDPFDNVIDEIKKIPDKTTDITELLGKSQSEYSLTEAKARSLDILATQANIRSFPDYVTANFRNLPVETQNIGYEWITNQKDFNKKQDKMFYSEDPQGEIDNAKKQRRNNTLLAGGTMGTLLGVIGFLAGGPVGAAIGFSVGASTAGGITYAKNDKNYKKVKEENEQETKERYAESVLQWERVYDDKGKFEYWKDENGNKVNEEDFNNRVKYNVNGEYDALDALLDGSIASSQAYKNFMQSYKNTMKTFEPQIIDNVEVAGPIAQNYGHFDHEQRQLVSTAVIASEDGIKFDYSQLTQEENQATQDILNENKKVWEQQIKDLQFEYDYIQNSKSWWDRTFNKDEETTRQKEIKLFIEDREASLKNADKSLETLKNTSYDEDAASAYHMAQYNRELESQAEKLGVSKKALELYGSTIAGVSGELKKLNKETAKLAAEEYEFNKAYNEGVSTFKDVSDAYDKWLESVESGGKKKISFDVADSVAELQSSLEDLFGTEISDDFLKNNNEQIKTLFKGTEEEAEKAYNALEKLILDEKWDTFGKRIIKNAQEAEKEGSTSLNLTIEKWKELRDEINKLEDGEILGTSELETFRTYINQAKMSYEELQQFLTDNHLKLETDVGDPLEVVKNEVPTQTTTQKHTIKKGGINPYTGKEYKEDISWEETIETIGSPFYTIGKGAVLKKDGGGSSNLGNGSGKNFTKSAANSKSSSKNEPDKQDLLKDESDRYHDVNVELAQIKNNFEKIEKITDRSIGKEWVEKLTRQFELLNDEISMTEEKIKIAQGELKELQGKLSSDGVKFDQDGAITNYFEAYKNKLNATNAVIQQYNSYTSADAQEKFKETMDNAIDDFNEFVENMARVDELVTDFIPGLEADIQEAIDQKTELKIKVFSNEIEVRLNVAEATRDWNEFKAKVIDDIDEDDILNNALAKLKDFETYYNDAEKGTIQRLSDRVNFMIKELNLFDEKGNMKVYGNEHRTAIEDLKKYADELMEEMESLHDLTDEIRESYLDMMDKAQEKFDEQLATYEQISALIEHDMNLVTLIYGDTAYAELAEFYNKQHQNNLEQLDFQKQQVQIWADQMAMLEEGSEEWNKAKENWMTAVSDWTATIELSIEDIQERFVNALDLVFEKLNRGLTDGAGLGYLEQEWDLINKNADRYLDTIDGIYAVQKLENKYQEAIDNNDGLKAQKELKKIMDDELKALREKDKLTQYDIDRAELRYQIALKQIALEEAQQNKTKMRLRRDSQGNYTYQYTADEEQVASLQNEMSDLYQQLYNLDAGEYKNNLNELYSVWAEFQQAMKEAALINDPEDRAARELLIQEQYGQLINGIVEQNELIKSNLYESSMSSLVDLYNQNTINYEDMTEGQKEIFKEFLNTEADLSNTAYNNLFDLYDINLVNFRNMTKEQKEVLVKEMLPQWESTLQGMADKIVAEGGFEEVCKNAFEEISKATQEYEEGLQEIQITSGKTFDELKNGIDNTIDVTKDLLQENNKLISSYEDQLSAIGDVIKRMEGLIAKYAEAREAAEKYLQTAQKVWTSLQNKDADETQNKILEDERKESEKPKLPTPTTPTPAPAPSLTIGSTISVKPGTRWYADSYGGGASGTASGGKIKYINNKGTHPYNINGAGWVRKKDIVGYATGGYTGSWNSTDGRLAFLHQKELVLNAQDTKNMLNAVQIVRAITENLSSNLLNKLSAISANTGNGLLAGADTLEQVVHIDAQFPNVTNSNEIEDALNNLVNRAAQHITKN